LRSSNPESNADLGITRMSVAPLSYCASWLFTLVVLSNCILHVSFGPEISVNGFERSNSKIPHDMLRCHRRWPIVAAAGSIGTHLRAKVQPHAPSLLDAACTQAFSHSLAEENVVISLAAMGECSSCQCLSASALLVVFPGAARTRRSSSLPFVAAA